MYAWLALFSLFLTVRNIHHSHTFYGGYEYMIFRARCNITVQPLVGNKWVNVQTASLNLPVYLQADLHQSEAESL